MPRGDKAMFLGAGLVGSGALIVRVVNGEAPVANLPQRTVILVMVGGLLVAMKAIGIRGRGLLSFVLDAREGVDVTLADCAALHAILTFSWGPLTLGWTLGCKDARDKVSRRGGWLSCHEMVLDSRPHLTMDQVLLYKDHLAISFLLLCIQFHPLTFDLFLFGDLHMQSVDISNNIRVNKVNKSIVD